MESGLDSPIQNLSLILSGTLGVWWDARWMKCFEEGGDGWEGGGVERVERGKWSGWMGV